jgi:glycine/D-amino acid oxidase-like deaminating enzyme
MEQTETVVIGAGLTGVTAALELARSGVGVTLIEQDERAMNRASLRNEGKIHLGFVFVHDASLATAKLMIAGACSFRGILARLAGPRIDALRVSRPFVYLVAEDSLLAPDEIERRYHAVEALYGRQMRETPDADYLGMNPTKLFSRVPLSAYGSHLRTQGFLGAFDTAEVAIDTQELAEILRAAVAAEPRIRLLVDHAVESVQREAHGFRVNTTSGTQVRQIAARHVINASWENRFKIDRTAGMEHAPGWLHRLKYRVIARVPETMRDGPSVTMVVGRYGDVVIRPDATAYFSWYPAGLQGWTAALAPPEAWNGPCRGDVAPGVRAALATALLSGIERWYPGASRSTAQVLDAGAIVAYGASDVDDPASGLHDRTRVGVRSSNGYHSVDPGKLTTAPLFGVQAARAVLEAMATV